jgi:neutral ceramidase
LESGATVVGMVVCDLVALDPSTIEKFRALVDKEGLLPNDHLLVSVTHTHSGPAYASFLTRYMTSDAAANSARFEDWENQLPHRMVEALRTAYQQREIARLTTGRGEAQVSVNRRLPDVMGEIRLHPNPDGPVDPELLAVRLSRPDGGTIATLVNYACHPVVLCEDNLQHSGDFAHFLYKRLEAVSGGVALFINGACGNINPARRGDFAAAEWVGTTLADAVQAALQVGTTVDQAVLKGAYSTVALPLKQLPGEADIDRYLGHAKTALAAHSNPENYEGKRLAAEVERAEQQAGRLGALMQRLQSWGAANGEIGAQIQALRIGEIDLVALPGENFFELGLSIKAGSEGRPCMVAGYSNRSVGYVPTEIAYTEGGYEVSTCFVWRGGGEKMAAAARNLMNGLRR